MDINQKLEKYKIDKSLVRFERRLYKSDWAKPQTGYVISFSEQLVLFYEEEDFAPRSVQVFPKSQLSSIRHGRKEKIFQKVIDSAGTANQFEIINEVDIADWQTVFQSLKEANILVTLESGYFDKRFGWDFAIGKIVNVFADRVLVRTFNVFGQWEDEPVDYPYDELTQVGFGDRYSVSWEQYLTRTKKMI